MPGAWSRTWKVDLSKVLLIGSGPLPHRSQERCSFPQLRTRHFKKVLEKTGTELRTLLLSSGPESGGDPKTWEGIWTLPEEGPGWIDRAQELALDADILVSAGPYNPSRLACLIAQERPVWADIPGDPLAENQALCIADPWTKEERRAAARAAILPVLCRADSISTISERQRLATIGQLHLLGRREPECMVPIHSLPIGFDFPFESQLPSPSRGITVALVGAFNTWLDHDALIRGLEFALEHRRELEICCIGGPIAGLHEGGFEAFAAWARSSRHSDRVHIHGWVPQQELPRLLQSCQAGIWMDRHGDEPLLGSRTRALLYGWMGMQIIGSPSTELAQELHSAGHLHSIDVGDAPGLSQAILALEPEAPHQARVRQEWMTKTYSIDAISDALSEWIAAPRHLPAVRVPESVLAEEHARLRDELSTMRSTTTWRLLSAAHRALGGQGQN